METPDFDDWVTQRGAALLRFTYCRRRGPGFLLECSASTVRSQIHRAPATLRTTIGTEEVKG